MRHLPAKSEALDLAVELMAEASGKLSDVEAYRRAGVCIEKRRAPPESERASPSRTGNAMRLQKPGLAAMVSPVTAWTLIPWTASR